MTAQDIQKAKRHIQKVDPILGAAITDITLTPRIYEGNYFLDLSESIVSQQLSVKAADTIWKRFVALFPDEKVTPFRVMEIDQEKMRGAGLSYQKIGYIKDLAQKVEESGILFEQFAIMTEEEIITELVKVKGIGRWTAEMFLMFALGRLDVFSYGDLGLRNALKKLYPIRGELSEKKAQKITEKWRPYRTIACLYLWKTLDL